MNQGCASSQQSDFDDVVSIFEILMDEKIAQDYRHKKVEAYIDIGIGCVMPEPERGAVKKSSEKRGKRSFEKRQKEFENNDKRYCRNNGVEALDECQSSDAGDNRVNQRIQDLYYRQEKKMVRMESIRKRHVLNMVCEVKAIDVRQVGRI
jgi:hypothetical protein